MREFKRGSKSEGIFKGFWFKYRLLYIDYIDDSEICGWYVCRIPFIGFRQVLCNESFDWYMLEYMRGCEHKSRDAAINHLIACLNQ